MNRKPNTSTTCAAPNCEGLRQWDAQKRRYRSRFCNVHALEQRAAKKAAAAPSLPSAYTPAEVLATWDKTSFGAEFTYRGVRVYGLQPLGAATYRIQLAGADVGVRIGAGETLQRLVKP